MWIVPCQVYSCHKCICKSVVLLTVNELGMINLYSTRFSNQSILLLFIFYLSLGGGGGGPGGGGGGGPTVWQVEEQNPQLPCPPTWTPLLFVKVEHHG